MSILTYRKPRVQRNTRPATIRPVPATFGAGLIDDEPTTITPASVDVTKLTDAEFEDHLYGDLERRNPKLAAEIRAAERKAKAKAKSNVTPSTLDQAWALGYDLGRMGVEDPMPHAVYQPRERRAFTDGHSKGLDEYHRDEIAATEAFCAQRDRWYEGSDMPWGDEAEYNYGSLVGHAG